MLKRLRIQQAGQGLVEYTLIIALVSVILIGALGLLEDGFGNGTWAETIRCAELYDDRHRARH